MRIKMLSAALMAFVSVSYAYADTGATESGRVTTASDVTADISRRSSASIFSSRQRARSFSGNRFTRAVSAVPSKTARANSENLPVIYGSKIFSDDWAEGEEPIGIYTVPTSDAVENIQLVDGPDALFGGVCLNGVYYYTTYNNFWDVIIEIKVRGVDMITGEEVYSFSGAEESMPLVSVGMDLDPVSGDVYGIFFNEDGSALQLGKVSYATSTPVRTTIAPLDSHINWCTFAIDADGQFYGISADMSSGNVCTGSRLYKIDRNTGASTFIGETGQQPQYVTDACFDRSTGRMFWTVNPPDETGFLCEVDIETGAATMLYHFPDNAEYAGIYVPAPEAEAKAPAVCQDVVADFAGGALSGNIRLKSPATCYDGSAGSGDVTIHLLVNGEHYSAVQAAYGAQTQIPVSLDDAGTYSFIVYASNAAGDGPKTVIKNVFVGNDVPEATSVTLTYSDGKMKLSWLPVTTTVNGGYLDLDRLTYKVTRFPGEEVVAESLKATDYEEALQIPETLTTYYYTVIAECAGLSSAEARSNSISLGSIVPPYTSDFENGGLDGFTVIDGNGDGRSWQMYEGHPRVGYNMTLDMDDWLVSPPLKLEAGKAYDVAFEAWSETSNISEKMEVMWGTSNTAEALTGTLLAPTEISGGKASHMSFSKTLVVPATGVYYIGFHGITEPDHFYLNLGNISVSAGVEGLAPAAPSDMTVVPAADGSLTATVGFTTPSVSMNGDEISSLTKVEVTCGDRIVKTFDNPACGARLSVTDEVEAPGAYTYAVAAYNEAGKGLVAESSVFVGTDMPAAVSSVSMSRTAAVGEVNVTWNAVTTDRNGNPIAADKVRYKVYRLSSAGSTLIAEGIEATSYAFQAVSPDTQDFVQCAVSAVTEGGESAPCVTGLLAAGKPYDGLHESGELDAIWAISNEGGASWQLCNDNTYQGVTSQDGDNAYFAMNGTTYDAYGILMSGLVSLEAIDEPTLSFHSYNLQNENGDPDVNLIVISARTDNESEFTEIYNSTVDRMCNSVPNKWGKAVVSLEDYEGKVIQIQIKGVTRFYTNTLVDNIDIESAQVGVEQIEDSGVSAVSVRVEGDTLIITGAEGKRITVASVSGMLVKDTLGSSETSIRVTPGVYLLKVGSLTWKIFVR